MSNNILTAFNDHFIEFVSDIQNVFPEDADILTAKNALITIRKANPKMIVKISDIIFFCTALSDVVSPTTPVF